MQIDEMAMNVNRSAVKVIVYNLTIPCPALR